MKCVASIIFKLDDDYHNKDNWDDFMNKCYEVLNVPCFSGKSFKEIIEEVVFES